MLARLASSKLRLLACHGGQKQALARVNTEALKYIAQGLGAVVELDRIQPYTTSDDPRLLSYLKTAKESFEMALEVENSNSDAMLLLSRLYIDYHIPGTCPGSGAALLETAADAGNPVAQYELACRLRVEGQLLGIGVDGDGMDEKAFKYLESAACKKHPGALFLMGSMYLAGKSIERNVKAAAWCFRHAADQGHAAAATAYGALMAKGMLASPTSHEMMDKQSLSVDDLTLETTGQLSIKVGENVSDDMINSARHYFEVAAEAGDGLALEWLSRIPVTENSSLDKQLSMDSFQDQQVARDILGDGKRE